MKDTSWHHIYVKHHESTLLRPNHGGCSSCDRNAEYVVKFPNGALAEYCRLDMWIEAAQYMWDVTGDPVFEQQRSPLYTYVEYLELIS